MSDCKTDEITHIKDVMAEQPKSILRNSVNSVLDLTKKIQKEIYEDRLTLNQLIETLRLLRTTSNNVAEIRNETDPNNLDEISNDKFEISDQVQSCGSDIISTGCDEETKSHVSY